MVQFGIHPGASSHPASGLAAERPDVRRGPGCFEGEVRKRHFKHNSDDNWVVPGAALAVGLATIGVAILAFQALDEPRRNASVESEVVRACELVRQFESNANRFPTGLDEAEFVSTGPFVSYFSNELAAHILADGPDGKRYECNVPKSVAR